MADGPHRWAEVSGAAFGLFTRFLPAESADVNAKKESYKEFMHARQLFYLLLLVKNKSSTL